MRKQQLLDMAIGLLIQVAFGLCLAGACILMNDNATGWIFEGVALLISIPVVILTNRKEKA